MNKKSRINKDTVSAIPRRYKKNNYGLYKLITAVGFLFLCCLLLIIAAQYFQQVRIREDLAEYEARIESSEARQEALEIEIERLQELGYLEALARERLGLVKPGEVIYQLED